MREQRPTPAEPLLELERVAHRARRATVAAQTRVPLVAWGAAWLIGFPVVSLLGLRAGWPAAGALALAAAAVQLVGRTRETRVGWQGRSRASWLVLLAASPLLVLIVMPARIEVVELLLGALWGVGLVLLAVAVGDPALVAIGTVILVTAAVAHVLAAAAAPLWLGVAGGGAMLGLGVARLVRPR